MAAGGIVPERCPKCREVLQRGVRPGYNYADWMCPTPGCEGYPREYFIACDFAHGLHDPVLLRVHSETGRGRSVAQTFIDLMNPTDKQLADAIRKAHKDLMRTVDAGREAGLDVRLVDEGLDPESDTRVVDELAIEITRTSTKHY